ncbi:MAG: glycosyltransferase family 4 protein [Firmicutes bacterium]|nr:glycosyltransferase family 4 protein [Bacillota bacterium]
MPNLTIINQQYPPEVAATGQIFRVMAEHMQARGFQVTVATGTPYYPGMQSKAPRREVMGGVTVRRLWNTTFPKKSFLGKLVNLLTFEISLLFYCIFSVPRDATVLVATAPPMAVLCAAAGRFFRRYRVVMTVQDLYPDVLAASGMSRRGALSYRVLKALMRSSMAACRQVVAISTDMRRHLTKAYGLKDVKLIPNLFPETIQMADSAEAKRARGWADKLVVQYSGNFGVAHECETLLAAVRSLQGEPGILFQIAGAGKNYDRLREACERENLAGIVFEDYAPLGELERHLGTADISVVILGAAFRDVLLPSKYYGILASGRGVLLISGCESDIRRDIEAEGMGLCVESGEGEKLAEALRDLMRAPGRLTEMGMRARSLYERRYAQEIILGAYEALLRER